VPTQPLAHAVSNTEKYGVPHRQPAPTVDFGKAFKINIHESNARAAAGLNFDRFSSTL
jgi:hypothetical protein